MSKTNTHKASRQRTFENQVNSSISILCFIIIILVLTIFNLSNYLFLQKKEVGIDKIHQDQYTKISYWKNFLQTNNNYFYGWIELAKNEYQLNNLTEAENALNKAEILNPNSEEIEYYRELFISSSQKSRK